MRVALAVPYRIRMFALLPVTFGVGTVMLWLRSLKWPRSVDATGLTLRNHRRVDWRSVKKIGVSRSVVDDHISQIRIHHDGGVSRIPARGLHDGEKVVKAILVMFEQTKRAGAPEPGMEGSPVLTCDLYRESEAPPESLFDPERQRRRTKT